MNREKYRKEFPGRGCFVQVKDIGNSWMCLHMKGHMFDATLDTPTNGIQVISRQRSALAASKKTLMVEKCCDTHAPTKCVFRQNKVWKWQVRGER